MTKAEMYAKLAAGCFGNTVPQWFDLDVWTYDRAADAWTFWGVRSSAVSAHPACRLNVPTEEVPPYVLAHFPDGKVNISPMVDRVATVTAWLEVWDSPTGLIVEGVEYPDTEKHTWRSAMPDPKHRRRWERAGANLILARHLNANSLDDLKVVLEQYPGHVVELSALDRCLGTAPHRNGCVWEVRDY